MGQTIPFQALGNYFADIPINNFEAQTIAVTNPGSSWVNFPQTAGAYAWIPPRWYGVIMPSPTPRGSLRVDLRNVPSAAYTQDLSDLTAAQITIHEDAIPFSPGQSLAGLLPSSPTQFNLAQVGGVTLTSRGFPWGTRWSANSAILSQGNVGVHNYDIPPLTTPTTYSPTASSSFPAANSGVQSGGGRGILYVLVGNLGGGGTVTFTIQNREPFTGNTQNVLTSAAIPTTGSAILRVAPGIAVVANVSASDIIGPSPRINVVVAVANQDWSFTFDQLA